MNKHSSVCGQIKAELDFLSRTSSNNRIVLVLFISLLGSEALFCATRVNCIYGSGVIGGHTGVLGCVACGVPCKLSVQTG